MLTVPEAARRIGLSPETIRRWIRKGKLRASKVGTQHLIEEQALEEATSEDRLPVPEGWGETATGEPMPDAVAAVRRDRQEH